MNARFLMQRRPFLFKHALLLVFLLNACLLLQNTLYAQPYDLNDTGEWLDSLGIHYSISDLKSLKELSLKNKHLKDGDLKHLKALPALRWLSLRNSGVGNEGMAYLADLTSLENLYLTSTHVTDKRIEKLRGLKNLRTLVLHGTKTEGLWMKDPGDLRNLQWLDMESTKITDDSLVSIINFPDLQVLKLSQHTPTITNQSIEYIKRLRGLRKVVLGSSGVTPDKAMELYRSCAPCDIRFGLFGAVTYSTKEGKLDLSSRTISKENLLAISMLDGIKYLDLSMTNISDADLSYVGKLTSLHTLKLDNIGMDRRGNLKFPPITTAGIRHLKGLTNLRELSLESGDAQYVRISSDGMRTLGRLKSLKRLNLNAVWIEKKQSAPSLLPAKS